jgi:hypothetical protein
VCKPPACERYPAGYFSFRRTTPAARQVIVFVHGFHSNANEAFAWWPYEYFNNPALTGFDIWAFNYESGLKCSDNVAHTLSHEPSVFHQEAVPTE